MGIQYDVFPDSMPFDFPGEFNEICKLLSLECDRSVLLDAIDNNQEAVANMLLGASDIDFKKSVYRDLFYVYVDDMREYFDNCKLGVSSNDDKSVFDYKTSGGVTC